VSADKLQRHVWSLIRRILHYAPLVPGGKFNISELIREHGSSSDRATWVELNPQFKLQLYFWWIILKTVDKVASIPAPERFPAWTFEFHTDAARHGSGGQGSEFLVFRPLGAPNQLRYSRTTRLKVQSQTVSSRSGGSSSLCRRRQASLQTATYPHLGRQCGLRWNLAERLQHYMTTLHHVGHRHWPRSRRHRLYRLY
jgi:hypothetical protein